MEGSLKCDGGAKIMQETADQYRQRMRFVETMRMAWRVRRTIWQNFGGTLAVDAVDIVLAAC